MRLTCAIATKGCVAFGMNRSKYESTTSRTDSRSTSGAVNGADADSAMRASLVGAREPCRFRRAGQAFGTIDKARKQDRFCRSFRWGKGAAHGDRGNAD